MTYLDDMVAAYVECALWSSTDDAGMPLNTIADASSIAPDSLASMRADCAAFEIQAVAILDAHADVDMAAPQFGHDFWLTRNRHGAGFWDRGLGRAGDALTDAAHAFGESDLYVGDDGRLHVS